MRQRSRMAGCALCACLILGMLAITAVGKDQTIPVGGSATVDNWQISVARFVPDATRQIASENMFNPEPSAGGQFAMVYIVVKNVGNEKANFNTGNFHLEGASGETYDQPWMIVCPNDFPTSDQFPGSTLKGNIAFDIAKEDMSLVKLYYKNGFWGDKTYFDLP